MIKCNRPPCPGEIDDGFCNACGNEPLPTGAPVPDPRTGRSGVSGTAGTSGTSGTAGTAGSSSSRSASGRSSRRGSTGTSRRLGGGLVEMPNVPRRNPESALARNPVIPEEKRFCRKCEQPVGRGRGGRPGVANGFCPRDRTPFSFAPKLQRDDMVGQYRIIGCLARGGFGWVYLAQDTAAHNMWVVLKGLLGSDDPDSRAAALAEQRILTQIQHANIVHIQTVVQHPDPLTGQDETYLVMEYVGGLSLMDRLKQMREVDPKAVLPVEQVLAYAIDILPAFGYLHQQNLVYCDFKPDNVIQTEDQLKLIDLGAVTDLARPGKFTYGTVGYQAPEIETVRAEPSVESDLFTIGRTMAVLSFYFAGYTRKYKASLPPAADVPLFTEFESYHRLLLRATHPDPEQRFASAADMAEQCVAVLREVVAIRSGEPRPGVSGLFGPETRVVHAEVAARNTEPGLLAPAPDPAVIAGALPVPRVDPLDPAANLLATVATTDPDELLSALTAAGISSAEGTLRLVRMCIEQGDVVRARAFLADIDADDWRLPWFEGLAALSQHDPPRAHEFFDGVRGALPGEPAPRIALGACRELMGRHQEAAAEYRGVWSTDHAYVSAAFGLARCLLATGDRAGAVRILESVPDTSANHVAAQTAALRTRISGRAAIEPLGPDLTTASDRLGALRLEGEAHDRLAVELLETALEWVKAGANGGNSGAGGADGTARVLGSELKEKPLRFALEKCYRDLARHVTTHAERIALVDRANEVRPWTWV
ncbi:tetratricopeptide repeat protein [Embleya sp. NPDC056575]|uniref:serine/threonine-protein kinase n=1 Tax=unclassified Embleya TaxID=2699296 RepID=UPI003683F249